MLDGEKRRFDAGSSPARLEGFELGKPAQLGRCTVYPMKGMF
jgi:hypothetical protein